MWSQLYCLKNLLLPSSSIRELTFFLSFVALLAIPALGYSQARVYEGEYILQVRPGSSSRSLNSALSRIQSKDFEIALVQEYSNSRRKRGIARFDESKAKAYCENARKENSNVLHCEPNFYWAIDTVTNDPDVPEGLVQIQAEEAWDITTGSNSVLVAITDTGVDYTHSDLQGNIWTNPGEIPGNGIDDDGNGYVDDVHGYDFFNNDGDPYDDNGHGTHVAGTIGARGNNGLGVVGVNWNTTILPVKFLGGNGGGSTYSAVQAVNYAREMGAQVINASWGSTFSSQILGEAVRKATQAGIIFVAAAGNSASDNDGLPHYPSAYPDVFSVAATDADGSLAYFSNYGQNSVHIAAPGVSVLSTFPGNSYRALSGTSMAAPHVSGAVALMLSHDSSLNSAQVRSRLISSADVLPGLSGKVYSAGRLNLLRAILDEEPGQTTARVLFLSSSPYSTTSNTRALRSGRNFYMGFSGTQGEAATATIEVIGRRGSYQCSFDFQLGIQGTNVTSGRLRLSNRIRPTEIRVSGPSGAPVSASVKSLKKSKKSSKRRWRTRGTSDCDKLLRTFKSLS